MGQALVNKADVVCALTKLSLVEKTGIEPISIPLCPRKCAAQPVWRTGKGLPKDTS